MLTCTTPQVTRTCCCGAAAQARYSKSVEGVVGALVDDTVALNKSTRQVEGLVKHQQAQLQDTKEALLRLVWHLIQHAATMV